MNKELRIANTQYIDSILIELKPVECPYCHKEHIPNLYSVIQKSDRSYLVFAECTNSKCELCYILLYDLFDRKLTNIKNYIPKIETFKQTIMNISPNFCSIYNEAYSAEQMELLQITGVGYRKALEYLIKDYLISKNSDNADSIKEKFLGNCINDIDDHRIKEVAKRATWLGNDETHYVRKWEDKDVSHLKSLIELCINWIDAEMETKKILEEMPE